MNGLVRSVWSSSREIGRYLGALTMSEPTEPKDFTAELENCPATSPCERGSEGVLSFEEWYEFWSAEAPNRAYRRTLPREKRDRIARGIRHLRQKTRENVKSGRVWLGLRPRM